MLTTPAKDARQIGRSGPTTWCGWRRGESKAMGLARFSARLTSTAWPLRITVSDLKYWRRRMLLSDPAAWDRLRFSRAVIDSERWDKLVP